MTNKIYLLLALLHAGLVAFLAWYLLSNPIYSTKENWGALLGIMFAVAGAYTMYLSDKEESWSRKGAWAAVALCCIGAVVMWWLGNA